MIEYRPLHQTEVELLDQFLYLAIHQTDPRTPVPRSILDVPEVAAYVENWGRPDDACFVAVDGEEVIGAAWSRIIDGEIRGYGNVDAITPEFAVAVKAPYRGQGIGSQLMVRLIKHLGGAGFRRASLSVGRTNPASRLYRRLGFEVVGEADDEFVMALDLPRY